jgi:hypothetical protein
MKSANRIKPRLAEHMMTPKPSPITKTKGQKTSRKSYDCADKTKLRIGISFHELKCTDNRVMGFVIRAEGECLNQLRYHLPIMPRCRSYGSPYVKSYGKLARWPSIR